MLFVAWQFWYFISKHLTSLDILEMVGRPWYGETRGHLLTNWGDTSDNLVRYIYCFQIDIFYASSVPKFDTSTENNTYCRTEVAPYSTKCGASPVLQYVCNQMSQRRVNLYMPRISLYWQYKFLGPIGPDQNDHTEKNDCFNSANWNYGWLTDWLTTAKQN